MEGPEDRSIDVLVTRESEREGETVAKREMEERGEKIEVRYLQQSLFESLRRRRTEVPYPLLSFPPNYSTAKGFAKKGSNGLTGAKGSTMNLPYTTRWPEYVGSWQ